MIPLESEVEMSEIAQRFRDAASRHFGDKQRLNYPPELRQMAIRYIAEARRRGAGDKRIADDLGIAQRTVRAWGERAQKGIELVPVEIVEQAQPLVPPRGIVLHHRLGFSVEISTEEFAAVLRALA